MVYLFAFSFHPAFMGMTYLANSLWIKKCNGENLRDKEIVVIFRCTQETWFNPIQTLKLHWQNHTHIVYKNVSSVKEMTAFLKKMTAENNSIKGLWIRAHGGPHSMTIGEESIYNKTQSLKKNNRTFLFKENSELLKPPLKFLKKNAVIILESCSTGFHNKETFCMADTIAALAPGITVIAPNISVCPSQMKFFWNNKQIDCKILRIKISTLEGLAGKFLNFYYDILRIFSLSLYGFEDENNTERFHKTDP